MQQQEQDLVYRTPDQVERILSTMGLGQCVVMGIAQAWQERISLLGTAYPQKLIGLHSWGRFNQAMREAPRNTDDPVTYVGKHLKGMELLQSTDGKRVIKVHAGSWGTGDPDAPTPTNANPLGSGTHTLVNQMALPTLEREFWVLLTNWERTGFRGELMKVVGISENGYLIGTIRIMLNADTLQPISTDGASGRDESDDTGFPVEPIV
jgi:hypothetical protein